uniref:Uncharacterized protein n=1 Tax=Aegilops tauschii subsp. strangulata TaxID=200361 RepID=A0A452YYR2_AEGTS
RRRGPEAASARQPRAGDAERRPGPKVVAGVRRRGPEAERTGSAGAAPASWWGYGRHRKDCAAARRRRLLPLPRHEGDDARVPASSRSSIANSPGSRSPLRGAASKV